MWKSLTEWMSWNNSNNEWHTWEIWQLNQPNPHFKKSEIFEYYRNYRINFYPPANNILTNNQNVAKYYLYCFGDFTIFLVEPHNNAIEYFTILLDVYDVCKGITRRLTGDPPGIILLRDSIKQKSLESLLRHNFEQYNYNYGILHAHTVVQFSLSTLIMRLVSNYLGQIYQSINFPMIVLNNCIKAYNQYNFGYPIEVSLPIPIEAPKISNSPVSSIEFNGEYSSSWPSLPKNLSNLRCSKCNRISENLWGKFKVCLDCHMKRICSECGTTAVIIGVDHFPKCCKHQPK